MSNPPLESTEEMLPTYPQGYDSSGRSLFYNESFVSRAMNSRRLFKTRPLRFGSISDLELVDVSSSEYSDIPSPEYALKEYIRSEFGERKIPVYIFDDHNHAFFAWFEALGEGYIETGANLLHFDDHLDGKKEKSQRLLPNFSDLKSAADFAQRLDFDIFIEPAVKSGLLSKVYWIQKYFKSPVFNEEDQYEIAHTTVGPSYVNEILGENPNNKKTIVDIDIDYFTHIDDQEQITQEIAKMRKSMKEAGVITIAISPGFLNEQKALDLVGRLLSPE